MSAEKESKKEEEKTKDTQESSSEVPNVEAGVGDREMEQRQVEDVNEKLKTLEDKYLRVLADYQNLQKRTVQEKEELYKFAGQKTIESLLPALDTFDYARSALNPESEKEKIIEDFNLVFDTLLKALKEIGLEAIDETGIPFDPFYHDPLQQVYTDELPNHTIMQILKRGYKLNNKVIRPALVSVSVNPGEGKKEEHKPEESEMEKEKKHLGDG